ncbi:hypothetical protein EZS27_030348, partial [termite gut metagenome]
MELTDNEVVKVRAIITAVDNGKKITDLPPATGGIESYKIEVVDITGESKQLNLFSAI